MKFKNSKNFYEKHRILVLPWNGNKKPKNLSAERYPKRREKAQSKAKQHNLIQESSSECRAITQRMTNSSFTKLEMRRDLDLSLYRIVVALDFVLEVVVVVAEKLLQENRL